MALADLESGDDRLATLSAGWPPRKTRQDQHGLLSMNHLVSRRAVLRSGAAAAFTAGIRLTAAKARSPAFSLPIGLPGEYLGDGFLIRHGYACENTWYNPGWLHTGEDFYLPDGNAARAGVYAVAGGEIVFAGSEYPGLVVIVTATPSHTRPPKRSKP